MKSLTKPWSAPEKVPLPHLERPAGLFLDRRQFLCWGATLGAGAALADRTWERPDSKTGLGVVGLGERGRRTLQRIAVTPGVQVRGLCDLRAGAVRRAAAAAGIPDLVDETRVHRLVADPRITALVATVPPAAMAEVIAVAGAAHKPVLLARPVPGLGVLSASAGTSNVELVPGLHLSLGNTSRAPSADGPMAAAPSAVELEIIAGSMTELESAAIEALELAWSLLGGPRAGAEPAELRAYGGPIGFGPESTRGRSLRGSLRFAGEDGVSRRLDLRLDHRPRSPLHGRCVLGSSPEESSRSVDRVAAIVPRHDGAPSPADLSALATGLGGTALGLDLRNLAASQLWWQRLRASAGC